MTPKVRTTLKVFVMYQNGEVAIYQAFREKILQQGESHKEALLRMMKKELE